MRPTVRGLLDAEAELRQYKDHFVGVELDEIENEMNVIDYISEKEILIHTLKGKEIESDGEKDEGGHQKEIEEIAKKKHVLIQSLTSEMGDILFDTLMLDMIVKRYVC